VIGGRKHFEFLRLFKSSDELDLGGSKFLTFDTILEPEDHYLQKSILCSHIGKVINNIIDYSGEWGEKITL
jgi:hypothetical protein